MHDSPSKDANYNVDEFDPSSIYTYPPLRPRPFPAGPALDVKSFAIFNPFNYYIFLRGEITTTDYLKGKYYFYHPDLSGYMRLKHGWNYIHLPCPIAPVVGGHVKFQLTSTRHGDSVFDNVCDINRAEEHKDGEFILRGDGYSGYRFEMIFTKTPFATICRVGFFAYSTNVPPRSSGECYQLYGQITVNKFVCFDNECGKAQNLDYGCLNHVPSSKQLFVIPVETALDVEIELQNGERRCIMSKKLKFDSIPGWMDPPIFYYDTEEDDRFDFGIKVEWCMHEIFFWDNLKGLSSPCSLLDIKPSGPVSPGALVEVFSVFFGNITAPCGIDLYGSIVVCDGDEKFNIFAGNKDCQVNLPSYSDNNEEQFRTLSLTWPDGKWVAGEKFEFYMELKDIEGKVVCVGECSWFHRDSRYDCRLCDVFKGAEGYLAALHYSVFKNGKKAKVSIQCCNGPYSIYGSVFAKYKDYDYSSTYEEQCYQSTLFKRSKEDALEVTRSQIPLLKSQVSTPSDCDELIICVDLWICPLREPFPRKRFSFKTTNSRKLSTNSHKRFRFNTNDTKSLDMVWGTGDDMIRGRLNVNVDWV